MIADPNQPPAIREDLRDLPAYEPVLPLEALARRAGLSTADVLKLDANENPYGILPAVREALGRFSGYAVYPDPQQVDLRRAVSEYVGAPPEQIVVGAGSDELIDLVFRALLRPGDRVLIFPPTFGMYRFLAGLHGVPVDAVERRDDFTLDTGAVLRELSDRTALVALAAPNNPTGAALPEDDLRALLDAGATVLLDEAYAEFAGHSYVSWMPRYPRLMILRTFSKWAGLAGLRVGYGIFPPDVAETLRRIKQPYNVNRAAEAAVAAVFAHRDQLDAQVRVIVAERDALAQGIAGLGWLRPAPSCANFLLCRVQGATGAALHDALAQHGVFVRAYGAGRLEDSVRISVPRPDQTSVLMERLRAAGTDLGLG